jgi:uncharacterized protein YbaR (Trm112 family)
MIDPELLEILCCPETRQPLLEADEALLARVNAAVAAKTLKNISGTLVSEPLDGALVTRDGARLYRVNQGIPVLLSDEAIILKV